MARVTKGDVFRDLGFDREEAEGLAMRTYLMAKLRKFIEKHKMTQPKAAEFFGTPRPKISYIQNGKIDKLSIDYRLASMSIYLPLATPSGADWKHSAGGTGIGVSSATSRVCPSGMTQTNEPPVKVGRFNLRTVDC